MGFGMHMMCRINAWLLFVVIKHFISLSSKNVNTAYIQHSSGADAPYTVSQSIPVFLSFGMKLSWPVIMSLVHGVSTVTKQGKWSYKSKKKDWPCILHGHSQSCYWEWKDTPMLHVNTQAFSRLLPICGYLWMLICPYCRYFKVIQSDHLNVRRFHINANIQISALKMFPDSRYADIEKSCDIVDEDIGMSLLSISLDM